jgi:hypothetical protein
MACWAQAMRKWESWLTDDDSMARAGLAYWLVGLPVEPVMVEPAELSSLLRNRVGANGAARELRVKDVPVVSEALLVYLMTADSKVAESKR